MNFIPMAIVCIGAVASFVVSSPLNTGIILAQSSPDPDTIVGGYNVSIEDFPYQVSIDIILQNGSQLFNCGGSIISQYYILTAAHCLYYRLDPTKLVIRVGSSYRNNGTIIPVDKVFVHPDFTFETLDKDVAVMRTVNPIQFTEVIQPIKLPPKSKPIMDDSIVTVSGWGYTSIDDPELPLNLMAVKIPVVNLDKCKLAYKHGTYAYEITRNMWCAGYLDVGGKGACQGDSGGPVVQDGTVVGIVSWGYRCAEPHYPDVNTYVAAPDVRDFITNHTGI